MFCVDPYDAIGLSALRSSATQKMADVEISKILFMQFLASITLKLLGYFFHLRYFQFARIIKIRESVRFASIVTNNGVDLGFARV